MKTTTTTTTTIKSLQEQWEEHYTKALNEVLNDETLAMESKTEGIKFLSYVNVSMRETVLKEFESISETFKKCDLMEIMLTGLDNLFGRGQYQLQSSVLGYGTGIILNIDEYSEIQFDPFVLENEMLTEYTVKKDDWYLTLHMYEDEPQELRFTAFEY
ncbi:hypothetical protein [Bacillus paranthracis]|uniref:hypothetical protein n=1 Tax=Bacillus paranthracis TaxID=2026186 RepID=UPI002850CA16|nr:hypothetical protein [Bacillus paranthracis]MDR4144917.1 hypothetical protein [Bacillus paranthracis]MDR4393640.1 hypothetical protein [Bacillus paranthracis]